MHDDSLNSAPPVGRVHAMLDMPVGYYNNGKGKFWLARKDIEKKSGVKWKDVRRVMTGLFDLAVTELNANQKFTIPRLVTFTVRTKPATKERRMMMFGKEVNMVAEPAKQIVVAKSLLQFLVAPSDAGENEDDSGSSESD